MSERVPERLPEAYRVPERVPVFPMYLANRGKTLKTRFTSRNKYRVPVFPTCSQFARYVFPFRAPLGAGTRTTEHRVTSN